MVFSDALFIFAPCGGCKSFGGKLKAAHFWRKCGAAPLRKTNPPSPRNNKSPCSCIRCSVTPLTGRRTRKYGEAEPYSSSVLLGLSAEVQEPSSASPKLINQPNRQPQSIKIKPSPYRAVKTCADTVRTGWNSNVVIQ